MSFRQIELAGTVKMNSGLKARLQHVQGISPILDFVDDSRSGNKPPIWPIFYTSKQPSAQWSPEVILHGINPVQHV